MGKTFSEIESEAMAFPANERATLARDLIESLMRIFRKGANKHGWKRPSIVLLRIPTVKKDVQQSTSLLS